jgi:hypothetical protein
VTLIKIGLQVRRVLCLLKDRHERPDFIPNAKRQQEAALHVVFNPHIAYWYVLIIL